jgi:hypothetical protein
MGIISSYVKRFFSPSIKLSDIDDDKIIITKKDFNELLYYSLSNGLRKGYLVDVLSKTQKDIIKERFK